MKIIMFLMTFFSLNAFAQYYPFPNRYPFPDYPRFPQDYCSNEQIETTLDLVEKACLEKISEFSLEHDTKCQIKNLTLSGCKAICTRDELTYARLRMNVYTNCRTKSARLKKTVITYYN
jgi:hypothetical protein